MVFDGLNGALDHHPFCLCFSFLGVVFGFSSCVNFFFFLDFIFLGVGL